MFKYDLEELRFHTDVSNLSVKLTADMLGKPEGRPFSFAGLTAGQ
jgi:hypothetical protein